MYWEYYNPEFECDIYNFDLLRFSPWSGHRNFGYDLFRYLQPSCFVELGSHYGSSFFSFCQAAKDGKVSSTLYAIDTWQGDDYTRKYDESVWDSFQKIRKSCYSNVDIHCLRCTFDDALESFEDYSIDLLHIDGSHHYDDIKHDFSTWISKVKKSGVILFHDISSDKVLGELMGSHIYWNEIKKEHPWTLEFDHSFGLGIYCMREEEYVLLKSQMDVAYYQIFNNRLDNEYKDLLRQWHFKMLDYKIVIEDLENQLEIKERHLGKYAETVKEKDNYISELLEEKQMILSKEDESEKIREKYIHKLENDMKNIKDAYERTIQGKDSYIETLEMNQEKQKDEWNQIRIQEIDKVKADYQYTLDQKDSYINTFEEQVAKIKNDYERTICGKDAYIFDLESRLKGLEEK